MKGTGPTTIEALLIGVAVVLAAAALPGLSEAAYAANVGHIELVSPAESIEAEAGGSNSLWVAFEPVVLGTDAGHIERLLAAESAVSEEIMGGGETTRMELKPSVFGHDAGYIERLLPAETVE